MRARAAGLLAAAMALAACGGADDNRADGPIKEVSGDERDYYWIDRSPYAVGISGESCESAMVTAEYVIDSDGHVYAVKILGSRPRQPKTEMAVKNDLFERRFDAAPDNPQQHSVRVRQEFAIDCGPGRPKWR